jgi:hypothetical protein
MPQLRGAALSADVDGCIVRDCAPAQRSRALSPTTQNSRFLVAAGRSPQSLASPGSFQIPGTRKLHRREENSGAA